MEQSDVELEHIEQEIEERTEELEHIEQEIEERTEELEDKIDDDADTEVKKEIREKIEEAYAREEIREDIVEKLEEKEKMEDTMHEASVSHFEKKMSKSNESFSTYNGEGSSNFNSRADLVNEVIENQKAEDGDKIKSVICTIIICLGSFNMGTIIGYPSPAVPNMQITNFRLNNDQTSWIGSIITLTALFGGLVGGKFMDSVGRKLGIMIMAVPIAVGWITIVASPNYGCILAGRAITGLGMGVISVICPVYLGEISPPSIRGILGSCHQLLVCVGILYTYGFGAFLNWQWLVVACIAFLMIMVVGVAFIPESPRHLLAKGEKEACKDALQWLRGENTDVSIELSQIQEAIEKSKDQAKFSEFAQPQLWKPLLISVGLMVFQQFSGINVVMFYTVSIFAMAGSTMSPNTQSIVVGVVGVVGTLVSVAVSDLVGRRILLIASGALMALSMAGLGTFFYEKHLDAQNAADNLAWLPLTCLILFNFGFDVAYGPIPWLMMGELFPQRAKGTASSISTACNWLCAFLMTKFWVNMTDAMEVWGGYWFCAAFCVASIVFILAFVPETKGKTLEEIERYFNKKLK